MKTASLFTAFVLALSLSGAALACGDGKNGECCGGKKAPSVDVTAADSALAEQAARSMLDSDQPRPDGKLTTEMKAKLARDSETITRSIKTGQVDGHTCHDVDGAACTDGECKSCCGGKKKSSEQHTGFKHAGEGASMLDGRTVALRGKCPDKAP